MGKAWGMWVCVGVVGLGVGGKGGCGGGGEVDQTHRDTRGG